MQFFKIFIVLVQSCGQTPPDSRLDMLKWLVKNPFKSLAIFAIGSPVLNWYLKRKVQKELQVPVYQKLVSGSRPLLLTSHSGTVIPRPQVEEDIRKSFLMESGNNKTRFGAIIGLSGCGKTYAVQDICNKYPKGVLYHEVQVASNFVTSLSQEIGMKLGARTALDLFLGYISQAYCHYYVLPKDRINGIQKVLEVLSKAAMYYQKNTRGFQCCLSTE